MFEDRADAGRRLARHLLDEGVTASVVLALPRGGVPVAAEVAAVLEAPLDVILVRKLGLPSHPEVAMGAIGEGGVRVLDAELIREAGVAPAELSAVQARERGVLDRRARQLRGERARRELTGRTVLIVDDGIATGATAEAACLVARRLGASGVIVAAPVGGRGAARRIPDADRVICLEQPARFEAVGQHYRDFPQTSDDDVLRLLTTAGRRS